jgi:4-amino-4-deoxy-L-arabinose transferase-like glycosyltransferase
MLTSSGTPSIGSRPGQRSPWDTALLWICAVTLLIRLAHLFFAMRSPFTHELGPDEDYYFRFAQAVASGQGALTPEFGFMDPAYGYLLGVLFWLLGAKLVSVFVLQILADTFTALCLFLIGRELGRPRAGLVAAALYGLTATAVMFSTTLLKDPLAAGYMALWVLLGLKLLRGQTRQAWLLFGLWCGLGVGLRANLLLMSGLGAALLAWLSVTWAGRSLRETRPRLALFAAGLALPLVLLAARQHAISQSFSPLPNNGGVVLHQLYNPDNPAAVTWVPPFVSHAHPSEIWRGYAEEAQRRTGRTVTPREVDRYWRGEARRYILAHPGQVAANMGRKLLEFTAYVEVPNNRSFEDERLFSPVLRLLPAPAGWLFALGVPGVVLLLARDRRGLLVVAPILATLFTFTVFCPEDRFRFHCIPLLALGAGLFLDDLYGWIVSRATRKWAAGAVAAALLGAVSLVVSSQMPQPEPNWGRALWGYLKMGRVAEAKAAADRLAPQSRGTASVEEALGYIAAAERRDRDAAEHYRRAIQLRPGNHIAHYNLAKLLVRTGDRQGAAREAQTAFRLRPLPEYQVLLAELAGRP